MSRSALLLAAIAATGPMPAPVAASPQVTSDLMFDGRRLGVTAREAALLLRVRHAIPASSGGLKGALAAARSGVSSTDGIYVLATYTYQAARSRGDVALQIEALDTLISHPATPPRRLVGYLSVRGDAAYAAKDYPKAVALWERVLALRPDDGRTIDNLLQARLASSAPEDALAHLDRALAARVAAGGAVSELWLRQRLSIAGGLRRAPLALDAAEALVRAYPTLPNWRAALVVYRQVAQPEGEAEIDLLRLMRAVGALERSDEYLRFGQILANQRLSAEARAVSAEGVTRGIIATADPQSARLLADIEHVVTGARTGRQDVPPAPFPAADALLGSGRHDDAAAAYARESGRSDRTALAMRRHGIALALGGRHQDAAAMLGAISDDGVARLWRVWSRRRIAPAY